MRKRLISICIVWILVYSIYEHSQTVEETSVAETETVEVNHTETVSEEETESITDAAEQEKQAADSPVPQEEPEPEKEIDFDGSDTHLSILMEYERAWEDETYTVEEWQNVAGVFMTLANSKWVGWSAENYTLYYSISDLAGDGTEELIIGIQGEDGIAPCFLYTYDGERIHMTDSRAGYDLVNIPTILYENGVIESTEYIKYGMYRYNFYQRPEKLRESGGMELIDLYFYIDDPENGNQYYKGDMANSITEEEFWAAINEYESLPQIELNWHELDGFWESGEDATKTTVIGEEYSQWEKEETEDEAESAAIEKAASKEEYAEQKKDEPITIVTKVTYYHGEDLHEWREYKYDSAGNLLGWQYYNADGSFRGQKEYEYDSAGNQVKLIWHDVNGVIIDWNEYKYDSAGNQVKQIWYDANGSINDWYEYRYDSAGNQVEFISYYSDGSISVWYEYEYDGAGNRVKDIDYWGIAGSHYGREYGSLYGWYEYEYDSAGNRVKQISYYDGSITDWREYEYDSRGNLMSAVTHHGNGSVYRTWHEYEYDSKGNKTRDTEYDAWGIRVLIEYEYDDAGNLTKMIEHKGENWNKSEYEYITITPQ